MPDLRAVVMVGGGKRGGAIVVVDHIAVGIDHSHAQIGQWGANTVEHLRDIGPLSEFFDYPPVVGLELHVE